MDGNTGIYDELSALKNKLYQAISSIKSRYNLRVRSLCQRNTPVLH
ncbi:hypothetical protein [Cyanobacterium aponinum]|nr:hypothetical protein [Cyanobacterium aponinum]